MRKPIRVLSISFVLAAGFSVGAAAQELPPNIVFIVVDDLDKALFDRMLVEGDLPKIRDHIVELGTTFTHAFSTEALCCPARATYLTGQYAHNHGVLDNKLPLGGVLLFQDETALPVWLQGTYKTGLVGKYLNGYGEGPATPSTSPESPYYVPPGWHFWRGLLDYLMYDYRVSEWDADSGAHQPTIVTYTGPTNYQTDVFGDMAVEFIASTEEDDSTPFFLYVAPFAPHQVKSDALVIPKTTCTNPRWKYLAQPAGRHVDELSEYATSFPQGPAFNEADVSDKPAFVRDQPELTGGVAGEVECVKLQYQRRAEAMLAVDDMVGVIVDGLGMSGETDNTVLIFTSDNGYYLGEHRLHSKIIGYEEAIRIPLVMAGPEIEPEPTTVGLVLSNDLAPTIADWAEVSPPILVPQDGRSLVPLLANPATSWRSRFLIEYQGGDQGVGLPQFYAVRTGPTDPAVPNAYYAEWEEGSPDPVFTEYYALATDPNQLVSDPENENIETMQGYLNDLKVCGQTGQLTCFEVE